MVNQSQVSPSKSSEANISNVKDWDLFEFYALTLPPRVSAQSLKTVQSQKTGFYETVDHGWILWTSGFKGQTYIVPVPGVEFEFVRNEIPFCLSNALIAACVLDGSAYKVRYCTDHRTAIALVEHRSRGKIAYQNHIDKPQFPGELLSGETVQELKGDRWIDIFRVEVDRPSQLKAWKMLRQAGRRLHTSRQTENYYWVESLPPESVGAFSAFMLRVLELSKTSTLSYTQRGA